MKKTFLFFAFAAILSACSRPDTSPEPTVDVSAVDAFFEIADRIISGVIPSEKDWETLFTTGGYKHYSEYRRNIIRESSFVAFHPERSVERDSLLSREPIGDIIFENMTISNFLDMREHWDELKEFRETFDFERITRLAKDRLEEFMIDPLDREIAMPTIFLVCQENDAQGGEFIKMDFNVFYKQTEKENINLIAHEMFHTYCMFQNPEYWAWVRQFPALRVLRMWREEGIADWIDKDPDNELEYFRKMGLSESEIKIYVGLRENTPNAIHTMDSLTCGYLRGEIDEEAYSSGVGGLLGFGGGHPNGFYISRYIAKAGLMEEMLRAYDSPFEFARLYNRAAEKLGGYRYSAEFMAWLDEMELQAPK